MAMEEIAGVMKTDRMNRDRIEPEKKQSILFYF